MRIEQTDEDFLIEYSPNRLDSSGTEAHKIVQDIEGLASRSLGEKQSSLRAGRQLRDELNRLIPRNYPQYDVLRYRAATAIRSLREAHSAEVKAGREAARSDRDASFLYAANQKKRIIAILHAVVRAPDPCAHIEHVRQCKVIWHGLGLAGRENVELSLAYSAAAAEFWRVVKRRQAAAVITKQKPQPRLMKALLGLFSSSGNRRQWTVTRLASQVHGPRIPGG